MRDTPDKIAKTPVRSPQPPSQPVTEPQTPDSPAPITAPTPGTYNTRPAAPTPPKRPDLQPQPRPTPNNTNFSALLQDVENLPVNERYFARRKVLTEWITVNPAAALKALEQIPKEHRAGTISSIASAWGKLELEAAAKWALSLPKGESERALASAVAGWAKIDQISAREYAAGMEPGPYRVEVIKSLVSGGPPRSTAEWLATLQEGSGRNQALATIFANWGRTSPALARAWVMQSPHGSLRDHATLGLSKGVLMRNPGEALRYAEQIEDTGVKAMQVRSIVNDYARTCVRCHRSGKPGCLRENVTAIPQIIVPNTMKSRVLNIVRRDFEKNK